MKDCKSEFISLFAEKGSNENDIVSVCAPGTFFNFCKINAAFVQYSFA